MKCTFFLFLFLFMTLSAWQTAASNPGEIKSLIKELKSKDPAVRNNASKTLTRIGAPAVPALVTGLPEADRRVRLITVRILNQMGAEAEESVPVLIELLRQENFFVHEHTSFTNFRELVSETLANIGSAAVPQLIEVLSDTDKSAAVPQLIEVLSDIAVPQLIIETLSDTDKSVHYHAASALGRIGPEARDAVFLLIGMLDDDRENIREVAVTALGRIGPEARDAVFLLIGMLDDDREDIREIAVTALGRIGQPAHKVSNKVSNIMNITLVPEWESMCEDPVREFEVTVVGKNVAPYLIAMLKEENADLRRAAAGALGNIAAPIAVPALIDTLDDKEDFVRGAAVWALGEIGAPAEAAVPLLINMIRGNDNDSIGFSIISGLGKIGSPSVIPVLIEALDDDDAYVRRAAIHQLCVIREPISQVVPALMQTLADSDSHVRFLGAIALSKIGEPAIAVLIEGLSDEVDVVRREAAFALGKIGPTAQAAVPALKQALKDKDKRVRQKATRALKQIAPSEVPDTVDEEHSGGKVKIQVIK